MSRAVHNMIVVNEDSDLSDFQDDMVAFNVCIRKSKTYQPRIDYFNVYDDNEFFKRFRLKKPTVEKVLNEIVHQLKSLTNR